MVTVLDATASRGVEQGDRILVHAGRRRRAVVRRPGDRRRGQRGRASSCSSGERSEIRTLPGTQGEARAFVEVLEPPLRLLVCGAGHDAAPLVAAGGRPSAGAPIVVDDRPEFLNRERFPDAADFVLVERPDKMAEVAPVDERTYVVVMTHNFLRDKDYVRSLLSSPARFVAMLGPAVRTERAARRAPRGGRRDRRGGPRADPRPRRAGPRRRGTRGDRRRHLRRDRRREAPARRRVPQGPAGPDPRAPRPRAIGTRPRTTNDTPARPRVPLVPRRRWAPCRPLWTSPRLAAGAPPTDPQR